MIEFENGSIEANNAQLRRRVRAALQRHALNLQDLSLHWTFGSARTEALSLHGSGLPTPAASDASGAPQDHPPMRGGGGGLCRMYYSKYKDKFHNGEFMDWSAAAKSYNAEKAKEESQILKDLEDEARQATQVCREQFSQHGAAGRGQLTSRGEITFRATVEIALRCDADEDDSSA